VSSFLCELEAFFIFLQCPQIFHLFLLFLFSFIAHFLLVENTYKNPYSLKAVNCFIASFTIVPCCSEGVAGCGCCRIATKSSIALANLSIDDVVGISTFSGKNSNVLVVQIPFVSGGEVPLDPWGNMYLDNWDGQTVLSA
jgi:hypothetical protein